MSDPDSKPRDRDAEADARPEAKGGDEADIGTEDTRAVDGHIDDDALARMLEGRATPEQQRAMLAHADACPRCRATVVAVLEVGRKDSEAAEAATERDDEVARTRARTPRPGDAIAHYSMVDVLGRGAMGLVVRARDNELGRDVAIKLLLHAGGERASRRLVREAQAMAQLQHPNVVTVHGVGRYEHGVYIAMELVRGKTLRAWCEDTPRPWDEVVRTFLAAGEGLVAAHEAGIVHRDFKPANVLVGDDGRVLVTDFGLARLDDTSTDSDSADDLGELGLRLTRTGAIMGTPRYMAPEQLGGASVDARADQFAFAVALYAALYGGFPYEGDSVQSLGLAFTKGQPNAPAPDSGVPGPLWPVLERALQADVAGRYPRLRPMLDELRALVEPRRRSRWTIAAAVGAAGVVGGLAIAAEVGEAPCTDLDAQLDGIWDARTRDAVAQSLGSIDAPDAETTVALVHARLDEYAQGWRTTAREVCEATHVHGVQSTELLDARMHCLEEGRAALRSLVDMLASRTEVEVLHGAVPAARALPVAGPCRTETRRESLERETTEIDEAIAHQEALVHLGLYEESVEAGEALRERVQTPTGRGNVEKLMGYAQTSLGHPDVALEHYRRAGEAAAAGKHDSMLGSVQVLLASTMVDSQRFAAAEGLLEAARLSVVRAGDPPNDRMNLATTHADILSHRLDHAGSLAAYDIALEAAQELDDELQLARVHFQRGHALVAVGRVEEGLTEVRQAIETRERLLGRHHPHTIIAIGTLMKAHLDAQRFADARDTAKVAIERLEAVHGPDSLTLAGPLVGAALAALELGDYEAGVATTERVLGLYAAHGGPDDPRTATPHQLRAVGLSHLGRHDEAKVAIGKALRLKELAWGHHAPKLAYDLLAQGEILRDAGDAEAARASFARAMELAPDGDPTEAYALTGVGKAKVDLGRAEGLADLEAALERRWLDPLDHAEARFELARARFELGPPDGRDAAMAMAHEAEATLRDSGARRTHARIVAWIAAHTDPE